MKLWDCGLRDEGGCIVLIACCYRVQKEEDSIIDVIGIWEIMTGHLNDVHCRVRRLETSGK